MKVSKLIDVLNTIAPAHLAAEWDNVGLLIGDESADVRRTMLCIDLTPAVLAEALRHKAQCVVTYHPPLFTPVSRLTAGTEPVLYQAARKGLAIYAVHTALDVVSGGTNDVLAHAIGLKATGPLEPLDEPQSKIVTFVTDDSVGTVTRAAFAAGAGRVGNYADCAFFSDGLGTFRGDDSTNPTIGQAGQREIVEEIRLEVVCPDRQVQAVLAAIRDKHPYETPAIDVYSIQPVRGETGMGRVGDLPRACKLTTLLGRLKRALGVSKLQLVHPDRPADTVTRVACAAGSCGQMWRAASAAGAELYVTGEMKHHDALAAAQAGLTVACVGHSHSERKVLDALQARLAEALPTLDVFSSTADRDPFEIV
jgi:dinuclear metal center YbgI/SA1388 family protein